MANSRVKGILLEKATDKELLIESLRRRNIKPTENNLKKYKLYLMDIQVINALRYLNFSKTSNGGIKISGIQEINQEELNQEINQHE
jgi:hypothetical protein